MALRLASTRLFRPLLAPTLNSRILFQRSLSDDTKSRIEKAVKAADVVVFMKGTKSAPQCGFSRAVVQILELQGAPFESVNILADEEIRQGIKEFTSWPTIPQVFVKNEFVGGCDILLQMHQNGSLEELLIKEGVIAPQEAETPPASTASQ
ncbi:hypothetical protein SmJEL517_g02215 [Synchytrium microbalum]|uniref:Monothiol glutaredoxin-5, mitochondrial n=1 Tax=Synchytrium microbalum TaxID=1806994 RepID=A0A507C180_9FUNG|nr:uncharacterized protein SmJEL517_g02215 [Synchytrium microbalum]TPX35270.1 hypothetical protein SmJEL517_g02215 [Synchytrium microbalum]